MIILEDCNLDLGEESHPDEDFLIINGQATLRGKHEERERLKRLILFGEDTTLMGFQ